VQDIDEGALTQLAQSQLRRDAVEQELIQIVATMEAHMEHQGTLEVQLDAAKKKLQEMEAKVVAPTADETQTESHLKDDAAATSTDEAPIKSEPATATDETTVPLIKEEPQQAVIVKVEPNATIVKTEDAPPTTTTTTTTDDVTNKNAVNTTELELLKLDIEQLTKELDDVILKKQRSQFDLARKIQQYAPLQESTEQQRKHLHFVKSDITMDKTVCEVSGNFMSARDADERIAAHYAGKQYVGWKLVRDKFKEMQQQYGRYGPPRPPPRRDDIGGPGPGPGPGPVGRNVGGRPDDRYNGRGGGFNNNRGPPPQARGGGGGYSGGGGGRDYDRGGGRDRDRGGHQGGGYGRGGGYDRDRRDGSGGGGRWGR
jgi:LUC7 N_terminus